MTTSIANEKKRSWTNRRAMVRYRCPPAFPGRVYAADDLEFQHGWLVDLSQKGFGIQLPRPLTPGDFIMVVLKSPTRQYQLGAHVARIVQQPTGEWIAGCELITVLLPDELDDLLN